MNGTEAEQPGTLLPCLAAWLGRVAVQPIDYLHAARSVLQSYPKIA